MDKWYLRSYKDGDAHYGQATGTNGGMVVTARCGLMFRPLQELFGDGAAVVRPPVDALQACPECRSAGEREPDGAAVRGLIDTLSKENPGHDHRPHPR